jgi:hypothetical protein
MAEPLVVNLPHKLGREEARRRIAGGIGKLKDHIPGGNAEVSAVWSGDRLNLVVGAMGQRVDSRIDVEDDKVRVEVILPGLLGMFSDTISGFLQRGGAALLEDKRK